MTDTLTIVIGQLNPTVGDVRGNCDKILAAIAQARNELKADIIAFPELMLTGYPPEDLLFRPDLHVQIQQALATIQDQAHGIDVLLGFPQKTEAGLFNAAGYFQHQQCLAIYHKQCLPNYGVFDEKRYFTRGEQTCTVDVKGHKIGLLICEDLWHPGPYEACAKAGAELVISINASPFDMSKVQQREAILQTRLQEQPLPIIYVHCIGGQDEVVFDGGSLAINRHGKICQHAGFYCEALHPVTVHMGNDLRIPEADVPAPLSTEESVYRALVLGVKDYLHKNGFKQALLGLSGGIDSALTLAIAVDAIGAENVEAISLPSRYTSDMSKDDAELMATDLNVKFNEISIEPVFSAFLHSLTDEFAGADVDITEENLQARVRGTLLMAVSNKFNKLVLTTGNKSEMAVGYSTLYGDMAGGFAVLKDVPKTLVYRLANYRNQLSPVIPQRIIDRAPTAELAHGQADQDTLPPYDILDAILERYVELDQDLLEICGAGFDKATVQQVINKVDRTEYKRRQAPPGIKITRRAFGRERRYPITSGFNHHFDGA